MSDASRIEQGGQTALISVFDKTGIVDLAQAFVRQGVRLLSTGKTFQTLASAGLPVTAVEEVTGFPEMLGGRVKSLHPHIHGGILARRDVADDVRDLDGHGIDTIDFVVANLYPFAETIAQPHVTDDEALEMIDIGGPAMIRAAAKNHRHVVVVTDPETYPIIIERLDAGGDFDDEFRRELATRAFRWTALYDVAVANYLGGDADFIVTAQKAQSLRYGENPHQKANFYVDADFPGTSLANARQLHGTALSFNNIMDGGAALEMIQGFDKPILVAVKHANPCGMASANTLEEAFEKVRAADPVSIFGGIVAANRPIDEGTARRMSDIFLEVVIAPGFDEGALQVLMKKKNIRLLDVGTVSEPTPYTDVKRVPGGWLVQQADIDRPIDIDGWQVVTKNTDINGLKDDLTFGWRAVKYVKSNAIAVVKGQSLIGVGAGQMNRVQSARLALEQAGEHARGAVLASDAFFPFRDVVDLAAQAGISAIVQTGGSIRDAESIEAADEAGIVMLFTGERHFRH